MRVWAAGISGIRILFPGQGASELDGRDEGEKGLMSPDAEIRSLFSRLEAVSHPQSIAALTISPDLRHFDHNPFGFHPFTSFPDWIYKREMIEHLTLYSRSGNGKITYIGVFAILFPRRGQK
jgi:hypothetical protein